MEFEIIEQLTIPKTGNVLNIVGRLQCECGQDGYVVQGKRNLYEYCTQCGTVLCNGKARQERLAARLKAALGLNKPAPEPAPAPEPEPVRDTEPAPAPAVTIPISALGDPEKLRGKSLLQIFLEWKPFGD